MKVGLHLPDFTWDWDLGVQVAHGGVLGAGSLRPLVGEQVIPAVAGF